MVEDSAAVVGVLLAGLGLVGSALVGNEMPDALASLLIGLLSAATAFGLARPLADYLIGRSLPAEQLQQLYAILAAAPAVEEVILLQAVYTGPDEIVVAAKVRPVPTQTVDALAHAMDDLDAALRAADLPGSRGLHRRDDLSGRDRRADGAAGRRPRRRSLVSQQGEGLGVSP